MRLLIAGGGTGGHLYPGIAVAEEVRHRGGEVLFVGTARGLEAKVVPAAGFPLETLDVSGLKRMGVLAKMRGLARLPVAFGRSLGIVRRFRPDVVLGVGGYASGPMVLTAALARVPTAIQEQNSVPGFTNRTLGRFVRAVFTAFEDAAGHFPARKVERIGNPVRRSFVEAAAASSTSAGPSQRLLVVGGSQGARAVNDLVLSAVERLAKQDAFAAITHQTGAADLDRCAERYRALGLADRVSVQPFIDDMVAAYRSAALVVGRAGALTLAELAVMGRPAILIPLPTAADDHQTKNAEAFARAGAAVIVSQNQATGETLASTILGLLVDVRQRTAMANAMAGLARPNAAAAIVERLSALVSG